MQYPLEIIRYQLGEFKRVSIDMLAANGYKCTHEVTGGGEGGVSQTTQAAHPAEPVPARRQAASRGPEAQGLSREFSAQEAANDQEQPAAARRAAGRPRRREQAPPAALQGDARRDDHGRDPRAHSHRPSLDTADTSALARRGQGQASARP